MLGNVEAEVGYPSAFIVSDISEVGELPSGLL